MKKPICTIVSLLLACFLLAACQANGEAPPEPDPETYENLVEAMAAEANYAAQYAAYAQAAEEEGRTEIANLLRAIADANQLHSDSHFEVADAMGEPEKPVPDEVEVEVESTVKNLGQAYTTKTDEYRKMYPPFLSQAEKVAQEEALSTFNYAMRADMAHAELLYDLQKFAWDTNRPGFEEIYLCPVCGNIVTDLPGRCVICHSSSNDFVTYTAE